MKKELKLAQSTDDKLQSFSNMLSAKDVIKKNDPIQYVVCNLCNKEFVMEEDKSRHIRCMHVTKYRCKEPNCNTKFALHKSLKIHEIGHKKEKDDELIKCTKCDKTFTCPSLLEGHISTHSKDRLHKCTSYQKAYKQKSQSSRHLKILWY